MVLVDDAEMLYNAPNSEILERITVSGRDADHGLILAGQHRGPGQLLLGLHGRGAQVQVRRSGGGGYAR